MLIPEFLIGQYSGVKPAARRFLRDVAKRGAQAVEQVAVVDSTTVPGLFALDKLGRFGPTDKDVQFFAPIEIAVDRNDPPDKLHQLFGSLLVVPWGPLALMASAASCAPRDEVQRLEFLRAVLRWWPLYRAEGERFYIGPLSVSSLWEQPTLLSRELGQRGVTSEEAKQPLPDGDLPKFLEARSDKFADVLRDPYRR